MRIALLFLLAASSSLPGWPADDMEFLRTMAQDVVNSSKVKPGGRVGTSPKNTSGFTLIKPGGGTMYPACWVRDFAMSLESGCITAQEMKDHLIFFARSQNGAAERRLKNNLVIPPHAISGKVLFDGKASFFPGTYGTGDNQGTGNYGYLPPIDNNYEFTHIAWCLFEKTGSPAFLQDTVNGITILARLDSAFAVPATDSLTGMVVTDSATRAVGFGFCDAIYQTGSLHFVSLLRYRAAGELAALYDAVHQPGRAQEYRSIQARVRGNLVPVFGDPSRIGGWLFAATGIGRQPDVWGTLFALHLGVLSGSVADTALGTIVDAVRRETIVCEGAVRHVPTDHDFSPVSAWERTHVALNRYQNGAYWHTPTGWLISAVRKRDTLLASRLFSDYLDHLRKNDFRLKGAARKAPWECFNKSSYTQNGIYMTSVTLPLSVLADTAATSVVRSVTEAASLVNPLRVSVRRGEVTLSLAVSGAYGLTVCGLDGRTVARFAGIGVRHTGPLQMRLGQGVYVYRLNMPNRSLSGRIVVSR